MAAASAALGGDVEEDASQLMFPKGFTLLEGRFEDEELQQILDDIQTKRSFQY
ncbi:DNA-directed RNA polymerase II subunit RPB4 [Boleophthalmus pectinirostris]|uniref:DNA-directed RNA polymerase II subunit RPB4 n=1 Tax=Boleophthalmus pectinirostris TaxID=150288 RepID=UPI00242C581D|nr:DNA-directed RNA polymerase II subunit RPB4 [Boleophthalmus pectinirostris]